MSAHRLDAASGFVAALLIVGGFALAGPAPPPAEPTEEIARHLADSRNRILTGDVLIAAGATFYLWFLAALRTHLRREPTLSSLAIAAGALAMTLVVAGVALQGALVLDEQTLASEAAVRLGFDGYNALITLAGFGFAATAAATAGSAARSGALSPGLRRAGWATALLQLATIPGVVATSGPFAPAAPVPAIAFWVLAAWSAAVALAVVRTRA